jgi:MraZ protein
MTILVRSFISTFGGSLDSKGRVCIPASYRQILAAQETPGVFLCPSFVYPALEGFGQTQLAAAAARLANLDPFFSAAHDDQAAQVLAESHALPIDENGRVRLPEAMIASAGLQSNVVFIGLGEKFQIWDPDTYAPIKAERAERARAAREAAAKGAP